MAENLGATAFEVPCSSRARVSRELLRKKARHGLGIRERHESSFPSDGEHEDFGRRAVESIKVVICSKCQQPIVSGENFGFVCFKIPGQEGYRFFHRRLPGRDCWEAYMRESR